MIEGVFTPAQKKDLARKLADTVVAIKGEALRPFTLVVLEEIKSGDWNVGGNSVTTEDVTALTAGASVG
jgi:4-oxalocrotonate tautomerase